MLEQGWRRQGVENAESERIAHSQGTSTRARKRKKPPLLMFLQGQANQRPLLPYVLVSLTTADDHNGWAHGLVLGIVWVSVASAGRQPVAWDCELAVTNMVACAHASIQGSLQVATQACSAVIQARHTSSRQALHGCVVICLLGRFSKYFQRGACQKK